MFIYLECYTAVGDDDLGNGKWNMQTTKVPLGDITRNLCQDNGTI